MNRSAISIHSSTGLFTGVILNDYNGDGMAIYFVFILLGLAMIVAACCAWRLIGPRTNAGPREVCRHCGRAMKRPFGTHCPICSKAIEPSASLPTSLADFAAPDHLQTTRRTNAKSALSALTRGDRLLYFKGLQHTEPAQPSCCNLLCSQTHVREQADGLRYCSRCGGRIDQKSNLTLQPTLSRVRDRRTELRRYLEVVATGDSITANRSLHSAESVARRLFAEQ